MKSSAEDSKVLSLEKLSDYEFRFRTGRSASDVESDAIAELAYALWEDRGCPIGSPDQDWIEAEQKLVVHARAAAAGSER